MTRNLVIAHPGPFSSTHPVQEKKIAVYHLAKWLITPGLPVYYWFYIIIKVDIVLRFASYITVKEVYFYKIPIEQIFDLAAPLNGPVMIRMSHGFIRFTKIRTCGYTDYFAY